jgi:hypothetical protein
MKKRATRAQASRLIFAPLALGTISAPPARRATIPGKELNQVSLFGAGEAEPEEGVVVIHHVVERRKPQTRQR